MSGRARRRIGTDCLRIAGGSALLLPGLRFARRAARRERRRRVALFYYHRVHDQDVQPVYQLGIGKELFRRQLLDLQKSYRFVPLMEALAAAREEGDGEDLASLSFDDGYRDNLLHAWPVLRELGIPATFFLVAGVIGTRQLLWYDRIKRLLESAPGPELHLPTSLGGGQLSLRESGARRRAMNELLHRLKSCDDALRRIVVEEMTGELPPPEDDKDARDLLLSWEEARSMEEDGARFGSHTLTHPLLPKIRDEVTLRQELVASHEILARHLRSPLPVIAYPGGESTPAVAQAALACGYLAGLTTRPGALSPDADPMFLPRRGLGPRSSLFGDGRHSRAILLGETEGLWDGPRSGRRDHGRRPASGHVVAAAFDDRADAYRQDRGEDPAFAGEEREILRMLPGAPAHLIEIGCGAGITAARLALDGWRVVATDISLEMLRRTQAAAPPAFPLAGLVRCDVQALPFRDGSTTVLLCHGVLEYVSDVPKALEEGRRVLGRGGCLIATVPNRMAPSSWAGSILRRLAGLRALLLGRRLQRVPARHRFPWQLDALAAAAGLTRADRILQTFTPVPPYLFPRTWLRLNNRMVEGLPRSALFRWWGTQYIARYDKRS